MKKPAVFLLLLICPFLSFGQVGIGTTSPNVKSLLELNSISKGLLLPRMTSADRTAMALSANDAGMVVYQTSPSKGIFMFDGIKWVGMPTLVSPSDLIGATLRWDGFSWVSNTNLFNQGSSIGININSPKSQLHIHTISSVSRLQITNPFSQSLTKDGLILGMGPAGEAFINQQESHPLLFAIDSIERVRIDENGNVGINKNNPAARLDVNGTVKLGTNGTAINSIIRHSAMIDIPDLDNAEWTSGDVTVANAVVGATVYVTPSAELPGIAICYAMVTSPGIVRVKFMGMADASDVAEMMFYITVIQ